MGGDYYIGVEMCVYVFGFVQFDGFVVDFCFQMGYLQLMLCMLVIVNGKVGIGIIILLFDLYMVGYIYIIGDFFGWLYVDDNGLMDSVFDIYVDEFYLECYVSIVFSVFFVMMVVDGGLLILAFGGNSLDYQLFFVEDGIFYCSWQGDVLDWGMVSWFKMLISEDISGMFNCLVKFIGESSFGDSQFWDDGIQVGLGIDVFVVGFFLEIVGCILVNEVFNVVKNVVIQQGL